MNFIQSNEQMAAGVSQNNHGGLQKLHVPKWVASVAMLLVMFSGCDQYDAADAQRFANQDANAAEGSRLFASYGCTGCHGNDARTPALGISRIIADIDTARDVENALFTLKYHPAPDRANQMVGIASGLNDDDIRSLAAFIASLN